MSSIFAAGAAAKKSRLGAPRGPRNFDVNAVAIEAGVPLPPKIGGVGGISQYEALAKRMKPGQVAWLDKKRAYGLKAWFRKNGQEAQVRKTIDGRYGCWLVGGKPEAEKAAKAAPAKGAKGKRT